MFWNLGTSTRVSGIMKLFILDPAASRCAIGVLFTVSGLLGRHAQALDVVNSCDTGIGQHSYRRAARDLMTERSLELTRSFNGRGKLTIAICAGDVRILPSLDAQFHLKVDLESRPSVLTDHFVRKADIQNNRAEISLEYPKDLHPTITLRVPTDPTLQSEINLGVGRLSIRSDALRGDRELKVGTGHITIFLRGDTEYTELVTRVGMGSIHDRRPGGKSTHFSASRTLQGHGNGTIAALVGVGSIELSPEE